MDHLVDRLASCLPGPSDLYFGIDGVWGDIFTTLGYPQTCSDIVSVKCVPHLPRSYEHYTQSVNKENGPC